MTSRSSTCGAGPEIARGARPNVGVREVQKFGSDRAWNEQLQKAARMLTINQIVPEFDLLPLKFPGFEFLCLPQTGFQITESLSPTVRVVELLGRRLGRPSPAATSSPTWYHSHLPPRDRIHVQNLFQHALVRSVRTHFRNRFHLNRSIM